MDTRDPRSRLGRSARVTLYSATTSSIVEGLSGALVIASVADARPACISIGDVIAATLMGRWGSLPPCTGAPPSPSSS